MRILTASDRALLVEAADLDEAMRLNLAWAGLRGVVELIPGARTVLVRFDPGRVSAQELTRLLASTTADAQHVSHAGEVRIPTHYDGEDLAEVAGLLGVSSDEVIARHLAATWQVAFSGFAPGFGYLVGSDPLFDVPRRSSPRTRVPTGSVGLAGSFSGVYPRESPGGWQLIGHTDAVMWDIDRDPPAKLVPGALVRFERAPRDAVSVQPKPARPEQRDEGAAAGELEVMQPGLQLLIQDAGRPGHAALGVSASGAADRLALRAANRAVGNAWDAPVLECVGAARLRYRGAPSVIAVTGASGQSLLLGADGSERQVIGGVPVALDDGDELQLSHPERGLRYVIAVRGGILSPAALGSSASDTLAGLGPAPLMQGASVAVGDPATAPRAVEPEPAARELPAAGELVELRVVLGPRDDWFTPAALEVLTTQEWEITSRSDRVGIRLQGNTPLERAIAGELPSEGAITGAIQVPPDGQPVLFLPDHPLTGGYPIVGAVIDADLDLAAQLPPGSRLRFRLTDGAANGPEGNPTW